MNEATVDVCVPHLTPFFPRSLSLSLSLSLSTSLPPSLFPPHDQIQKAECSVKMQKAIIRPSECTSATYDG